MAEINYLDFDLLIERAGNKYQARVLNSPAGQASATFRLPFSDLELENFLLRVGRTRRGVRRLESPEMEAAKTFGGKLFDAVFADEVRACLRSSLDEASRQDAGLRLRLRLAAVPELADLPWEYLYNSALNRFLTLSAETPLVRYLDLPERIQPLAVTPPLRVLVMIASPSDYPQLDVDQEWTKLKKALGDLERRGLVVLERLEEGLPDGEAVPGRSVETALRVETTAGTPADIGDGPVVLAVDTLPCELPVDASTYFGQQLSPFMPALAQADLTRPLAESGLPPELQRATIVYNGKLTAPYGYLAAKVR